ncbi:DUF4347 domain-containing protein [Thermodesulfobacteriota bacterium]
MGWRIGRRIRSAGRNLVLEQLEERIVLDASVADVNQDQNADQAQDSAAGDGPGDAAQPAGGGGGAQQEDPSLDGVYDVDLSAVLISNSLDNVDAISDAVDDGAQVVVYDAATIDMAGITDILAGIVDANGGQQIGHLAFITHADPGVLQLGDLTSISTQDLLSDPLQLSGIRGVLAEGARIDFYGCNLGAGENGTLFVDSVANGTGAVVWASDDATGNMGGSDWDLEVKSGDSNKATLLDGSALDANVVLPTGVTCYQVSHSGQTWTVWWGTDAGEKIKGTSGNDIVFGLGGADDVRGDGGTCPGFTGGSFSTVPAMGDDIVFGDWPDSPQQLLNAIKNLWGLDLTWGEAVLETWVQSQTRWAGHTAGADEIQGDLVNAEGGGNDYRAV